MAWEACHLAKKGPGSAKLNEGLAGTNHSA